MQVVLFCGGLGTRLRDISGDYPKPLVKVGQKPVLRHVMNYYASYGHTDFVLCLGYKAGMIRDHFTHAQSSAHSDDKYIRNWNITFVDTGIYSSIGQRLKAAEPYIHDDIFLANYADGLTDLHLPDMIGSFHQHDVTASFVSVRPAQTFHVVMANEDGIVRDICDVRAGNVRINGGYFVFKRNIFNYIAPGDDLADQVFGKLIAEQKLLAHTYNGFWSCMDTFQDKQVLDRLCAQDMMPWAMVGNRLECLPQERTLYARTLATR